MSNASDLDSAQEAVSNRFPNLIIGWQDKIACLILEQRAEEAERAAKFSLGHEKDSHKARAADLRWQAKEV